MFSFLSTLPEGLRHFLLGLFATIASVALTYVSANQGLIAASVPEAYQGIAALLIAALLAYFTPLVKGYGVGSKPSDVDGEGISE